MLLIKSIEKHYYDLLSNKLNIPVYNHLPEDANLPLIKIAKVTSEPWVLVPLSRMLQFNFEVFSAAKSNIECLEILEELEDAIFSEHNVIDRYHISHQIFNRGELAQIENDIWCAELSIKVYVVGKH